VDELVAFVRRCLDEDERVVRQMMAEPGGFYLEAETDSVNIMTVGAYVYRWPPKRVLAEVEAKRSRIGLLDLLLGTSEPGDDAADIASTLLRIEAQPYAGQPGWREEWQLSAGA
jgi:hypothetical protein